MPSIRPRQVQAVRLDMTAVKDKLAESAQIAAILEDIFTTTKHLACRAQRARPPREVVTCLWHSLSRG